MIRAFLKRRDGVTAVEFASVLPPLVTLIAAAIEFGVSLFLNAAIEYAVMDASRFGSTGAENQGDRTTVITDTVVAGTFGLIPREKIEVAMRSYSRVQDYARSEDFTDGNGNGAFDAGEAFNDENRNGVWDADLSVPGPGKGRNLVVYEVTYEWGFLTPVMQRIANHEITRVQVAVENEPF
ncbi:TadE/TadG family type IV pilus assembly protein [Arenibaculum pallidiluteum]|uniref:TadE/TadG family type IV pilus assembly protein n=1 Tax=Arenibaculum pallidiluteum TaxID=2812559 RepID=UPI001A966733|nr:TadE/TadG family type IV pilus assembly protein [Arenibaculum pallidiluteum]